MNGGQDPGPAVYLLGGGHRERAPFRRECDEHGWETVELDLNPLTASSGRKLSMLPRCDASDLYVAFHRRPVGVVALQKAAVRATPEGPLRDDRVISLAEFCRYKAYAATRPASTAVWVTGFQHWLGTPDCEDHRDPRCLPFHMFNARRQIDLSTPDGRKQFNQLHRLKVTNRPVRIDQRRVLWDPARPNARHGREPITVAGLRLEDGVHWDVTHQRSASWRIAGSDVVWEVHNYINVYPDGATRIGDRCFQKWSRKDSAKADARDRSSRKR